MMKGVALLVLGAVGAQAQTTVTCSADANGDGQVGVDGKPSSAGCFPASLWPSPSVDLAPHHSANALLRSQTSWPCSPSSVQTYVPCCPPACLPAQSTFPSPAAYLDPCPTCYLLLAELRPTVSWRRRRLNRRRAR